MALQTPTWTSALATTASRLSWLRYSTRSARARPRGPAGCKPQRCIGPPSDARRSRRPAPSAGCDHLRAIAANQRLTLALDLALVSSSFSIEAAQAQDPIVIAHIRKAVDDMTYAVSSQDIDVADVAFHRALMHASGNPALTFFADTVTRVLRRAVLKRRALLSRYPIYAGGHELFDTLSLEDL